MNKIQKKKHNDTKISLHPLSFEQAMSQLAQPVKRRDSEAEESGNSKEADLESVTSKKRTARHPKSSSH